MKQLPSRQMKIKISRVDHLVALMVNHLSSWADGIPLAAKGFTSARLKCIATCDAGTQNVDRVGNGAA